MRKYGNCSFCHFGFCQGKAKVKAAGDLLGIISRLTFLTAVIQLVTYYKRKHFFLYSSLQKQGAYVSYSGLHCMQEKCNIFFLPEFEGFGIFVKSCMFFCCCILIFTTDSKKIRNQDQVEPQWNVAFFSIYLFYTRVGVCHTVLSVCLVKIQGGY